MECWPKFKEVIQETWNVSISGTKMCTLVHQLKKLKTSLKLFNKLYFCDIEGKAIQAKINLDDIQTQLSVNPAYISLISKENNAMQIYKIPTTAITIFFINKQRNWTREKLLIIIHLFSILGSKGESKLIGSTWCKE